MTTPELKLSVADGVARLVLDRPKVLNALSPSLLNELIGACADLAHDDASKVVLLEGADRNFSAGADLPSFLQVLVGSDSHAGADLGRRAVDALAALPQITMAAIRGHCVGGALVLAAACDLRVAADQSRFSIPELDVGIPVAWGGMARLIHLVGETLAADLVLSCRPFGPDEALRAGIVSRIIPTDEFDAEVTALAAAIAGKSPHALRVTKQQLIAVRDGTFDARSDAEELLASLKDPVAKIAGQRYVAERIGKQLES